MKCKATKAEFDACIGIHPTTAEEMTTLKFTKEDNPEAAKTSC